MIKEDLQTDMLEEVLHGLKQPQKTLPSKFFYDERGSKLFDLITELDEYYPTRTEVQILEGHISEIGSYLGEQVILIEPGSGSSDKTRILLDQLEQITAYVPIDISGQYLYDVARELQENYSKLEIKALTADYTRPFELPALQSKGKKVVFFPGSTIGNFKRDTVDRFLEVVSSITENEGGFLIGVDLKKDREILKAAYNDAKGVTAAFNKNILMHLNRELQTDFDPEAYRHEAIWNEEDGRIEMHLIASKEQEVHINGSVVSIHKGESIHTENSHKYTLDEFAEIVDPWFKVKKIWTDKEQLFSLQYLEPR